MLRVERTYGISSIGWAIFWLCLVLAVFALAVFATVHSMRHGHHGLALALRLLLIWAVPIGGPATVLLCLRRAARNERPNDEPPRTNQSIQRMRASRSGQSQFSRQRRLALTADAGRYP
jgi:hypothetical protein